jgi:hypothetical protein
MLIYQELWNENSNEYIYIIKENTEVLIDPCKEYNLLCFWTLCIILFFI